MPDVTVAKPQVAFVQDAVTHGSRQSALHLIHQLLSLRHVSKKHVTEQLKIGLWKWTEAEGMAPYAKFNTRYFSAGVMTQRGPASINHEHVWTLKNHVKALTKRTWELEELERYLTDYGVACIVTVYEHGKLSGSKLDGWDRYAENGIAVYDRATSSWLDFDSFQGGLVSSRTSSIAAESAPEVDMLELITTKTKQPVAPHLAELLRMARFASAVAVPSYKITGELEDYFRIHDTLIEEPTRAVAYPHWTGKVDFGLSPEDLSAELAMDDRIRYLKKPRYAVSVRVEDASSRALAEELLFVALEKLRALQ
jgi:hypothetical protein